MRQVKAQDAVGMILCHDVTRIVPGVSKGPAFRKGHIIAEADISLLLDMGKYHVFVQEMLPGEIHEEEAAQRLGTLLCGENLSCGNPSEGKVVLSADIDGLCLVRAPLLAKLARIDSVVVSTIHGYTRVKAGQAVAGAKVIPLTIHESILRDAEAEIQNEGKVMKVLPLKSLKVGIVVTGTEVYEGRIMDAFGPILEAKIESLGGSVIKTLYSPDDATFEKACILELLADGAEMVMVSGGMSVDPDDVTPHAISMVADEIVSYGSPVLPGAMFMTAYKDNTPIVGVPACGMFRRITVLDLLLPRFFAGVRITKRDIDSLAYGGFCLNCEVCHFPICPFGKSSC